MKLTKERLKELQDLKLPTATFDETFKLGKQPENPKEQEDLDAIRDTVNKYLQHFLPYTNKCICCGAKQLGTLVDQAFGMVHFTWGLAHGSGHCSKCNYPATLYHKTEEMDFRLLLQAHPDTLSFER